MTLSHDHANRRAQSQSTRSVVNYVSVAFILARVFKRAETLTMCVHACVPRALQCQTWGVYYLCMFRLAAWYAECVHACLNVSKYVQMRPCNAECVSKCVQMCPNASERVLAWCRHVQMRTSVCPNVSMHVRARRQLCPCVCIHESNCVHACACTKSNVSIFCRIRLFFANECENKATNIGRVRNGRMLFANVFKCFQMCRCLVLACPNVSKCVLGQVSVCPNVSKCV